MRIGRVIKQVLWGDRAGQNDHGSSAPEPPAAPAPPPPPASQGPKLIRCAGITDRGLVRKVNEDHFLIADLVKSLKVIQTSLHAESHGRVSGGSFGKLLLVADGMGGHNAGQRASELAIESVNAYLLNMMHWLFQKELDREHDFEEDLKSALRHSNSQVRAEAGAIPNERNMGTTLTMGYVVWPQLYVVHAGDSRCYLFRSATLEQITTDHTFAQQFVEEGAMSPDEVDQSPFSHYLWNVVGGGDDTLTPAVYKTQLQDGDRIVFCTDGLTRCVSDQQIIAILAESSDPQRACQALIDAALKAGGPDNVTVLVAAC